MDPRSGVPFPADPRESLLKFMQDNIPTTALQATTCNVLVIKYAECIKSPERGEWTGTHSFGLHDRDADPHSPCSVLNWCSSSPNCRLAVHGDVVAGRLGPNVRCGADRCTPDSNWRVDGGSHPVHRVEGVEHANGTDHVPDDDDLRTNRKEVKRTGFSWIH